jgi:glycerol kinase
MQGVLALDQGSHASRACVYDSAGVMRAMHEVPVATQVDAAGRIEHNADELAESLQLAAAAALSQLSGLEVSAAGLATQRSTVVCFERSDGQALGAAISWQDRRNAAWLDSLTAQAARVRALTGLPLSPHYGASKLRWCLDHRPAVRTAAERGSLCTAPLSAFLVARLGRGPPLADPANASRTLLYDSAQLDWSDELLTLFGIERSWLPACVATRADFGTLSLAGRRLALRAVSGDQSAVPFASGEPDPACLYVNLGTGAFLQRPLTTRPAEPAPLLGSIIATDDAHRWYSLEGTVNGAGSAVSEYLRGKRLHAAALWPALEALSDETALPVFVNGVGGLGSPWWRAQQATGFIGRGGAVEELAAILESVVFMIAANFRHMARQAPAMQAPALQRVLISGGLSHSGWLCRRLAAVLGVEVQRVASEATARGTAALAAPELARQWPVPATERFAPQAIAGLAAREQRLLAELERA